jgi:hypothetical protein
MRILAKKFNQTPEKSSRPMSATACGFVPGSGAGALGLEELNLRLHAMRTFMQRCWEAPPIPVPNREQAR